MSDEIVHIFDQVSSFSDLEVIAKIIANIVSVEIGSYLGSIYVQIFGGVVSVMASAIVYMYFTQKSERKEAHIAAKDANDKLFAVLKESTQLITTVKGRIDDYEKESQKNNSMIKKMAVLVSGCKNRDKRFDDNLIENALNLNNNNNNEGEELKDE